MVPLIETERLRLRSFRESDLGAWSEVMGDSGVVRFLGGTPFAREDVWRRLAMCSGLWPLLGFGYWAVERKGEGDMVGQVGFADFKRDLQPSIDGWSSRLKSAKPTWPTISPSAFRSTAQ